jgi:prepilin peptidase CpaA
MRNDRAICRYGIGFSAAVASLVFLYKGMGSFPLFFASLFFLIISVTDTLYTKVPNFVNLILIIIGYGFQMVTKGESGLLIASLGCLAGFALLFPAYLCGLLGAGDVKALAALGVLTGATGIFQVFLYTSLIGGVIAIFYYLASQSIIQKIDNGFKSLQNFTYTKDIRFLKPAPSNIRFPYAAAIAFGYFAYIHWGNII